MIETGKIINGDCVEVMKTLPEGSVDLIVTSPPYGVGIDYDVHEDDMEFNDYQEFAKNWLSEAYRLLKDDGRIALTFHMKLTDRKKVVVYSSWLRCGELCKRLVMVFLGSLI